MKDTIESRIKELETKGIEMSMLEEAKVINNAIGMFSIKGANPEDVDYLKNMLKDVMRKKFSLVFPNLDKNILEKLLSSYYFGMFYVPYDIEILGNAAFVRCHVIDDFGDIDKDRVYSLNNGLLDINHYDKFNVNIEKSDFDTEEYEKYFDSKYIKIQVVNFICNSINNIYGQDIVRPYPESDNLLYDGIEAIYGYKIAINLRFDQICKAMYYGTNTIIYLSIIEGEKNINYYEIEQTMKDNKPSWKVNERYTESYKMSKILKK